MASLKKPLVIWGALAVIIIISLVVLSARNEEVNNPDMSTEPVASTLAPELPSDLIGRYLLTGTIVWDRGVETWSRVDGVIEPNQPFSGLHTYSPDDYDAWLADLECPTSGQDLPEDAGGNHRLEFNCRQEYLGPAAQYFEFFNLANNHSGNSGVEKLEETRQALAEAGFQYFGDPEPGHLDRICEVVGLPVRLLDGDELKSEARLPVALCGWHYFYRRPLPGEIEVMQRYAEHMPVFAFVHMGSEYQARADAVQRQIARSIIDAGAEFVVGNNPHWVQDAEAYKGKPILYSTGNFIFDQQNGQEVRTSVSLDLTIEVAYSSDLQKWLDLGSECISHDDDCLNRAISEELPRLDIALSYDVVAGDLTGRLQTKADQQLQNWVENRLGWDQVLRGLSPTE